MRPIYLSLSGLQSYRQKQEIDFTGLNGSGVFGIFGPTGSGKSTILDAITLALFGEVERAVKGTQGIMNQAETVLTVSFTFELSRKHGPERYRVERQFKREDDVSLSSSVTRIIHLRDGEQVVLADKHKDVNNKVQEILGLSMADFTRAVVLPQGKFAEFLALKGAERRKMLQRLFHLEEYGEKLNKRLGIRLDEAKQEKERILAEQQGLGDASLEAVEAAQERQREAEEAARTVRERRLAADERFEALRQQRVWQEEAARFEREAEELNGRSEEWQERARKLEEAARAARLKPLLEARQAAARTALAAAAEQERTEAARQLAAERHETTRAAYERARDEWAAEDSPLSVRLEQLGQALGEERDIRAARERLAELAAQEAKAEQGREAAEGVLTAAREKLRKGSALQAELREQLQAAETRPEDRELLRSAERTAQELAQGERHAAELTAAAAEAAATLEQLAAASAADAVRRADTHAALIAATDRGERLASALAALEQRLGELAAEATAAAEESRRAQASRERERLAAELAHALVPGAPCPVCGALKHPAPAAAHAPAAEGDAPAGLERLAAEARERGFGVRQAQLELTAQLRRLAEAGAACGEAGSGEAAGSTAAATHTEALRPDARVIAEAAPALASDTTSPLAQQLAAATEALAAWKRELSMLEQAASPLVAAADRFGREQAERTARQTAAAETAATAERRAAEARERAAELAAAWSRAYGERTPTEFAAEAAGLAEKDRMADNLRDRLRKSEPYLADLQTEIDRHHEQLEALKRDKVRLETERTALSRQTEERQARLNERIGAATEPLEAQIASTRQRLEILRQREREGRAALEQETRLLEEASHRATAARQAQESAAASQHDFEERWSASLAAASFRDADEVSAALLDSPIEEAWTRGLQEFRERTALLREKLAELAAKRDGRFVSDDDWNEVKASTTAIREEDEAALERRARAVRDREELQTRHVQWKALEERRGDLDVHLERMGKLQTVLRGNAFIDYVAKEQLVQVTHAASDRLGQLTRRRYAIEVDSEGGFIIRDDANGGIRRPVSTLSGGETFLTSLALALALSAQIQLTGEAPLEFFFLDEGFGTLDPDLLDTVVSALEQLQLESLTVGVISHVPELRARLPKRLIVEPAEPSGGGSRIRIETL